VIKRIGHDAFSTQRHDAVPVSIESVNKLKGWVDEVLSYCSLGDEIHDREKEKRFVRGLVGGECRPACSILICSQAGKAFEILIQHYENSWF